MTRGKTVRIYGVRGSRVRVFTEVMDSGNTLVRVQWREAKRRRTESWEYSGDNVKRAKLFAEGVWNRLQSTGIQVRERLTLRGLFERYVLAREGAWRAATGVSERTRWRVVETVLGAQTLIERISPEVLDDFRGILRRTKARGGVPMVPNQIAAHVAQVKRVFRFAAERRYLSPNPIADYANRLSKDEQRQEVAEYTPEEFARILAQLNYRDSRQWRPWVAIVLGGLLGPRQRALLNLRVADDLDLVARVVHWPRGTNKLGRERTQPLPRMAVFAIRVALVWHRRLGYTGPWLFMPVMRKKDVPWRYAGLVECLHSASRRAGVEPKPLRAMHGLRRMAAKNVLELTGNIKAAGDWIGDTDVRVLSRSYLRQRDEEQRPVADRMESIAPVPRNQRAGTTAGITEEA